MNNCAALPSPASAAPTLGKSCAHCLERADEFAFEAVARSLGMKAGDVRINLKRAVGLLRGEAAYGRGGARA